jgi:hypothetical protein
MANRSTTSEYQPIPPYLRVQRGFGGTKTGGNPGRAPAFASTTGTNGARVKGNMMASGGTASNTPFGGGTARGAMRINPKVNGTGD